MNSKALKENNFTQEKFFERVKRPKSRFDGVKFSEKNTVIVGGEERSLSEDDSLDMFLYENRE